MKDMRHQQGEDQGNKLFPVAMAILPGFDTKRGEKSAFGTCHVQGRRLGGRGCWLGVFWQNNFISHWKRSVHDKTKTSILHLGQLRGCPAMAHFVGRGSFATAKMGPVVHLLSHGLSTRFYPMVPRDQGDSLHAARIAPGSP